MGISNPEYSKIIGNADIVELSPKRTWNATDGVQTYRRFAGTANAVIAKFNELSAAVNSGVDDLDEDINGKAGMLLARVLEDSGGASGGNTEELNAVWEVYAQPLLKPIESHTDFDSIKAKHKRAIEKAARDAEPIPATDPDGEAWTPTDAEKMLYAYYANQVLDFKMFNLELRKSTILSSRTEITASYAHINEVVDLPSIPFALIGVLTNLPKMDGSTGAWQWLKEAPQIRQVAKRKFQLSYSWTGAERWAEIYPGGSWTPTYE